jgi:CheY-like chemotaxis protein
MSPEPSRAARRILVVDDDPGIGQMLTKALARHGYEVDAATSADEALARSEQVRYDAALVDLVMPGRDGADLSSTLRQRLPGLPIGLLTGYTHSPLIPAVERSGMAVFTKPVLIQDLVDFLQRELG